MINVNIGNSIIFEPLTCCWEMMRLLLVTLVNFLGWFLTTISQSLRLRMQKAEFRTICYEKSPYSDSPIVLAAYYGFN